MSPTSYQLQRALLMTAEAGAIKRIHNDNANMLILIPNTYT